jgi:hypothetical protein
MSWETRPNGLRYYTRTHRVNGRVVRVYIGGGAKGNAACIIDFARRQLFEAQRRQQAHKRAVIARQIRRFETDLLLLDALTHAIARAELEAAGFHQHARGQWRKRRVPKAVAEPTPRPAVQPASTPSDGRGTGVRPRGQAPRSVCETVCPRRIARPIGQIAVRKRFAGGVRDERAKCRRRLALLGRFASVGRDSQARRLGRANPRRRATSQTQRLSGRPAVREPFRRSIAFTACRGPPARFALIHAARCFGGPVPKFRVVRTA